MKAISCPAKTRTNPQANACLLVIAFFALLAMPVMAGAQPTGTPTAKLTVASADTSAAATPLEMSIAYRREAAATTPHQVNYALLLLVALVLHLPILIGIGIALVLLSRAAFQPEQCRMLPLAELVLPDNGPKAGTMMQERAH